MKVVRTETEAPANTKSGTGAQLGELIITRHVLDGDDRHPGEGDHRLHRPHQGQVGRLAGR
ncbi:hypothetical protein [Lentzea nigeriaca]|uniref:hypothetical protein n=1 Tax=Lentzea nigeriaca TaxID=1128665 RepID=UPI00195DFFBB|nr:hypothetical protein [Lentzea nigeriaca]MBM7863301.1 hypothetical protein [Lentzea nigeriaca]